MPPEMCQLNCSLVLATPTAQLQKAYGKAHGSTAKGHQLECLMNSPGPIGTDSSSLIRLRAKA